MRFKLYREYGALNSRPVFDAFEQGLRSLGHEIVETNEDVAVIWSVLWSGKLAGNEKIYKNFRAINKPVLIIEVGNLKRGVTWRVSLDHINRLGEFANNSNLDPNRPNILGVNLRPVVEKRRDEILICTQHERSLQWEGMPPMKYWCEQIINTIKLKSSRKIIVRPHPRSPLVVQMAGVVTERPRRVPNTYDDFDIFYNYHCIINYNSGPAVQAAINGTPIYCDSSSLAGELSIKLEDIENPVLPNREEWFLKLCHTEWTVEEIRQGVPLLRLMPYIQQKLG